MDAPKRIWAWVDDLAGIVGQSEAPETPPNLPAGPNAISPCAEYILAAEHARIVAERDAEIARLREVLRKIADADRLPTPSYGGVPGQYDYLPRSGRFGMMARAALGDDDAQREEGTW